MALKFSGSFEDLKQKLSPLGGEWDESQANKKTFKLNSGLMNWFDSTGTINFQGKDPGKSQLEEIISILLNASASIEASVPYIAPVIQNPTNENAGIQSDAHEVKKADNAILEHKYLTSGVTDGELILGIVSAVGTEYQQVTTPLRERLERFGYSVHEVRVSQLLPVPAIKETKSEYERIKYYMTSGDTARENSDNNAILAAGVAQQISHLRNGISSNKNAYIINSLKHPREVEFLRKIYGAGFYLIGIHADEKRRNRYLTQDKGCTLDQANELIKIDEDESVDHGQKTRDTYHLSDFFLNIGGNTDQIRNRLQRFLELIFSHPYKNPTFDEFAMFMAFNSSVRSGDLSRQVGAVITRNHQILATGANDVPKSGGGQYFAEIDPETGEINDVIDGKDYTRKIDSNKQTQAEIISEIAKAILDEKLIDATREVELQKLLKESKISDLTEFGRVIHAEMDALLSCGREGISTLGSVLYCTTFPCHNCAKHIIAGGVTRVVYVEPYPKSKALDFHSESVHLRSEFEVSSKDITGMVIFEPFTGVGPRRFLDLFSMSLGSGSKLKRKNKDGTILEWDKAVAPIRTPLIPKSYLEIEKAAAQMWVEVSSTNGK